MDPRINSTHGAPPTRTPCPLTLLRTLQGRRSLTTLLTAPIRNEGTASAPAGAPHIHRTAGTADTVVPEVEAEAAATEEVPEEGEAAAMEEGEATEEVEEGPGTIAGVPDTVQLSTIHHGEAAGAIPTPRDSGWYPLRDKISSLLKILNNYTGLTPCDASASGKDR